MNTPVEIPRALVVEKVFAHAPEKVWRALTEGPLIAQWLMDNDFEPQVGKKVEFRATPLGGWNGIVASDVRVVEPMKRLEYSWVSMGFATEVGWTLTPVEGGTHVRFEQTGFGPGMEKAYQGAKYGWQKFFTGLERVLEDLK
jgi:uncharacterized protein YndB with AHSA1/START domain